MNQLTENSIVLKVNLNLCLRARETCCRQWWLVHISLAQCALLFPAILYSHMTISGRCCRPCLLRLWLYIYCKSHKALA